MKIKSVTALFCVSSMLLTACSTTHSGKEYTSEEILKAIYKPDMYPDGLYWGWSPNIKEMEPLLSKWKSAKDAFGFYCQSGHQIRKLSTKITAVITLSPSGVAVSKAAEIIQKQSELVKKNTANFYLMATKSLGDSFTAGVNTSNNEVSFSAVPQPKYEQIVQEIKSSRTKILKNSTYVVKPYSQSFIFVDRDHPLILASDGLPEFEWKFEYYSAGIGPKVRPSGINTHVSNPESISVEFNEINRSGNHFGKISQTPITVALVKPKDAETIVYPLGDMHFIEWANLFSKYTMLIPKETQQQYFEGRNTTSGRLFHFIDENGNIQTDKAVTSQGLIDLWEDYFKTFTVVREAQSLDPQIVNYEVELNLEPFCAYGRPIEDLISK